MLQKNFRYDPKIRLRRFVLASHEIVLQWNATVSASPLLFALESIHPLRPNGHLFCRGQLFFFSPYCAYEFNKFLTAQTNSKWRIFELVHPLNYLFPLSSCTISYSLRTLIPIYLVPIYLVRSK